MKQYSKIVLGFLAACMISGISVAQAKPHEDLIGKTFYTTANITYERHTIPSVNFHIGEMLPVGTKIVKAEIEDFKAEAADKVVSILAKEPDSQETTFDKINIETENGETFVIQFIRKYSSSKMTVRDYFDQYFTIENPMRPDGPFQKLTEAEKKNIRLGDIEVGMSKAAVLMSWGYPPSRKTVSLTTDRWTYWETRRKTKTLIFLDGKLAKIK